MSNSTRTANMPNASMSAVLTKLSTVLNTATCLAARTRYFDNATLRNVGAGNIYVCNLQNDTETPAAADRNTLLPGESLPIGRLDTQLCYVAVEDAALANSLDLSGTPAFQH